MFKSATSYLWGSSSSSQEENNVNENENKNKTHHQSSASLPDLDELNFDEKKDNTYSQSISQLRFHQPLQFKTPPIDIILDKETKLKLSATSSISFLFNKTPIKSLNLHQNNKLLSRYPYFIASNRNAHYVNKTDFNLKTTISMIKDEENKEKDDNKKKFIINVNDLNQYLDSLMLTKEEKKGILQLCEWVKTEKLSIKLCQEMWMAEIIITYFGSLSPTNPDLFGCWKRWITYRRDDSLYNVNAKKLKQFFDSGIFSIGFDNQRRPIWFINTEFYDDTFGAEIITKASSLWVTSMLWNLTKNEYDMFALRRGLSVYVNLSHWSINMASWNILQSVKKALVAYPYWLVDIYVVNIPTFMYLIKQLAAKIVVPHAMEKFKILADSNEYFEKYAPKHKTPICAGGTLKVSATQWVKDRGFLDYIESQTKHHRSPSAPTMSPPSIPK